MKVFLFSAAMETLTKLHITPGEQHLENAQSCLTLNQKLYQLMVHTDCKPGWKKHKVPMQSGACAAQQMVWSFLTQAISKFKHSNKVSSGNGCAVTLKAATAI